MQDFGSGVAIGEPSSGAPDAKEPQKTPRRKKKKIWLIIPLVLIALTVGVGVWYSLPYFEGEAEYARLRDIAYGGAEAVESGDAVVEGEPGDVLPNGATVSADANMNRVIDWDALRAVNPDVIGWIYVPNTPIDYPVVQDPPSDPGKYLHTTFEGHVQWPNNEGTIYLDCGNIEKGFSSEAPLLYGHYQLNQGMFSVFSGDTNLDTLNSHNQVYIYTPDGALHIELFAARIVNANRYKIRVDFTDKADLNAWLDEQLQAASVAYDPGEIDQLWTLCTCSYSTYYNQRTLTYGRTVEDTRASAREADEGDWVAALPETSAAPTTDVVAAPGA